MDHLAVDKTSVRVLSRVVVVCGEFPIISAICSGFLSLSSGERERNCRFFWCKNVDETWWVACFLWQFGGSKKRVLESISREAGFSTAPFTM